MAAVSVEPSRRDVPAFVLLTVLASWLVWLPLSLGLVGVASSVVRLVGAFAPSAVAVLLSAAAGRAVLGELVGRLTRWRVGLRWYAFALGFPAATSLFATAVAVALGSPVPDFTTPPAVGALPLPPGVGVWVALPAVFLQSLVFGSAMGEELGWRGYLLPRLQARFDALQAGLFVGLVWGVWHLPLWLVPDAAVAPVPAILGVLADAVLFTWLFDNTQGSLVPALVFHASIATTGLYLASTGPAILRPLVTWAVVALVVRRYGAGRLTGRHAGVPG